MKVRMIGATTHLDRQNERFTREALEGAAEQINLGARSVPIGVEHDILVPPIGKVVSALVERREDGEYQLVEEGELFEDTAWYSLGRFRLFREEGQTDKRPLTDPYSGYSEADYLLEMDPNNFASYEAMAEYEKEIAEESGIAFKTKVFGRKSAVPDPELLVKLAGEVIAYLVAAGALKKFTDKVSESLGEDVGAGVSRFFAFIRTAVTKYARYAHPKNRPITYVFFIPGPPTVEFVARSDNPEAVLEALHLDRLETALKSVNELVDVVGAVRVQFRLDIDGEWRLNYMSTSTGGVIGTEYAYMARARRMKLMNMVAATPQKNSESVPPIHQGETG